MTYRSRKLLDVSHTAPCRADFPHDCLGWQASEPAHCDSQLFGRGAGHKSPDWAVAHLCHNAHMALDGMEREEGFYAWLRAFVATMDYLFENGKVVVK